jgi:hypothetical protein
MSQRIPFTVGSDPEFFLSHRTYGMVPATEYNTPGTKLEPTAIVDAPGSTFHRDNIMVELQPLQADNPREWVANAQQAFDTVTSLYSGRHLQFSLADTATFDRARIKDLSEAQEIGCEPDKCAYTGEEMTPTDAATMDRTRCAGGHIHIGVDGFTEEELRETVKLLDVFEGVPMLRTEEGYRVHRTNRRRYYGQAGRYRVKPYGVEWRTPSNCGWHSYMEGNASNLFSTINCVLPLVKQGVTSEDIGGSTLVAKSRLLIDGDGLGHRKRIAGVVQSWKDCIAVHKVARELFEEEAKNGHYPTLYAA